jgi:hypothetical protein
VIYGVTVNGGASENSGNRWWQQKMGVNGNGDGGSPQKRSVMVVKTGSEGWKRSTVVRMVEMQISVTICGKNATDRSKTVSRCGGQRRWLR